VRVLYLSYYFPPVGGAGVQRTLKFVRYLPEFGIEPVVLTGPGTTTGRWTPIDHTLAGEVAGEIEVFRSRSTEPTESTGWDARANRWLRSQSDWAQWWQQEVFAVGRRIPDVDILLCSMSPFESAPAAARLASELGIPWVADLRDPWALDEMMTWPSALHRRLEEQAMRRSLASAAAIVMNTATAANRLRERFPEFQQKHVVSIPNGFDAEDFAGADAKREDDAFRIVHTGYLHTQHGLQHRQRGILRRMLGGSAPDVDFLPRSHVVLMAALDRLATLEPSTVGRVEVLLAGALSDVDRAAIGERRNVRAIGYLSHTQSVELMRSADALFLPMHDLPLTARATIVPGKTYEYLASGRPVIAAVPQGDARDLLETVAGTFVCRPSDEVALAAAISELAAGGRRASIVRPELLPYERRALTQKLATLLESVARQGSPDAPSVPESASGSA
jgi:glycosyltransferase involved in cell wall biosynthesis